MQTCFETSNGGRKSVRIPWKTKGKNQESDRDDIRCVMWNEGNPKEADNRDVNAKKYIKKEWSKEAVGLDSVLLKTATTWGSSNRIKYYEKWKMGFCSKKKQ